MFFNFQYDFKSSPSHGDRLTVASDRIDRAFNISWVTRAVPLDICNTFDRVWDGGRLYKHKVCVCYIFASSF